MNEPPHLPVNLRVGLYALALFAAAGLILESLHGFKIGAYLDVGNETRRLLWRLAHAHGALLGLTNVVYALTARAFPQLDDTLCARALLAALILMPLGFFLGGVFAHAGDPGASVGLAAAGGVAMVLALSRLAWKAR